MNRDQEGLRASVRRAVARLLPLWSEAGPIVILKERHLAREVSRRAMASHHAITTGASGLAAEEIYTRVVQQCTGCDRDAAAALLRRAAQSFTEWPEERPLNFRDVVHYMIIEKYLASDRRMHPWARVQLGRIVASVVPAGL